MTAKLTASADGSKVLIGTAAEDALEIDATTKRISALNGYDIVPAAPVVAGYNSNAFTITSNVDAKVPINAADVDSEAWLNVPNNRYIPQVAGWYWVYGAVYFGGVGITLVVPQIRRNGAVGSSNNFATFPSQGDVKTSVSALIYCNGTTDYIELWGKATATGALRFEIGCNLNIMLARAA